MGCWALVGWGWDGWDWGASFSAGVEDGFDGGEFALVFGEFSGGFEGFFHGFVEGAGHEFE